MGDLTYFKHTQKIGAKYLLYHIRWSGTRMKKGLIFRVVRIIFVLTAAAAVAIFLYDNRPKGERRQKIKAEPLVEVFSVEAQSLPVIIEAYGTVRPQEVLKLVSEISGRIVDIHPSFKEGSFGKKGIVLLTIDPRTYRLEVERRKVSIKQADVGLKRLRQEVLNFKASAKIAKSDVALTRTEFFRLKELSGKKAVARTNLDKAEQRYLQSLERLQAIENQIALTGPQKEQLDAQRELATVLWRQAKLNLEKTRIVAPFDGWVLEKTVEKGQHVNTGQYLGQVYKEGAFEIDARITVNDLKWLPSIQRPKAVSQATIVFSHQGNTRTWMGRVTRIKANMDEKTRRLPIVVEITPPMNSGEKKDLFDLRPGMFVKVRIEGKKVHQVFVLPRHTVHTGNVVYTVHENRLRIRPVNVLRRFKESIYIQKGLTNGDLVIKTPLSEIVDGSPVSIKKPN